MEEDGRRAFEEEAEVVEVTSSEVDGEVRGRVQRVDEIDDVDSVRVYGSVDGDWVH